MRISRILLAIGAAALLSSYCSAVTIIENEALTKNDDPRLTQKITISADGVPVSRLLAQLGEMTGIQMNAGIDKDDWMVQDRKVIVHVTDMPLRELMQELTNVLSFHWSRGGEPGKWSYRFWQDKPQRLEEESLRASAEDERTREFRQLRENAISDMINLAALSASDAARLKSSDPWRYLLATEPLGRDVAEFLNSFPDARSAFVQGSEVSVPVSGLSPQLQASVRRIAESYDGLLKGIGAAEDHSVLLTRFEKLQITINRRSVRSDLLSRDMLGRITIGTGPESFDIPLFDPASPIAKAIARAVLSLREGATKEAVGKQLQQDLAAAQSAAVAAKKPSRDILSDPALRVKIKLFDTVTNAPLPMTLKALAERSGLDVVSDYFIGPALGVAGGEKPLGEHLESISALYGLNWTKAGNTLRFRDKEWFKKRAWEVPQVWLDYWYARGKANDGLRLDEYLQIANLRDEQIDHTILLDPKLIGLGAGDAARNRHILRFYSSLDQSQRDKLTEHLPVTALSEGQWALLQKALATKGAAYAAASRGGQTITFSCSGSDVIEYKFTYYPGGTDQPVVFKMISGVVYNTPDEVAFPKKK